MTLERLITNYRMGSIYPQELAWGLLLHVTEENVDRLLSQLDTHTMQSVVRFVDNYGMPLSSVKDSNARIEYFPSEKAIIAQRWLVSHGYIKDPHRIPTNPTELAYMLLCPIRQESVDLILSRLDSETIKAVVDLVNRNGIPPSDKCHPGERIAPILPEKINIARQWLVTHDQNPPPPAPTAPVRKNQISDHFRR